MKKIIFILILALPLFAYGQQTYNFPVRKTDRLRVPGRLVTDSAIQVGDSVITPDAISRWQHPDWNNVQGKPVIPTNNNQLANGANYAPIDSVKQAIQDSLRNKVVGNVSDSSSIDSLIGSYGFLPAEDTTGKWLPAGAFIPTDNSQISNGENYLHSNDTTGKWMPSGAFIPTDNSQIGNGAGYITEVPTVSINLQSGTTYTLVLSDRNKLISAGNAGAITITVPPNSAAAFPVGTVVYIQQAAAGQVTAVAGAGVTVNSPGTLKTRLQYSICGLIKTGADTWIWFGDYE